MGKKKNKFSRIPGELGNEFVLKGRHPCLCEASKHKLINNCLNCGRIVCEQEGVGPCFTCKTFVCSKEERNHLMSGSNEAMEKIKELTKTGAQLDFIDQINRNRSLKDIAASLVDNPNLNKAIEHKDKLLEFDKKSVARSKVYDDQMDYFSMRSQNFIYDQNRKAIADKVDYIVENKFNKIDKIQLDIENLTISDCTESVIKDINEENRKLEELSSIKNDYEFKPSSYFIQNDSRKKHLPPPVYVPNLDAQVSTSKKTSSKNKKALSQIASIENNQFRLQNYEIDKIEDKGMCLAVQQPYASLLVMGIKKFEGRMWYSPFRGRLWIYAAQRVPKPEEIQRIESFYQNCKKYFPKDYPTGVIVGCVIIEDCLPLELCLEAHFQCEIESPYVFICGYPIAFQVPLPLVKGGGRRIYPLEPSIHKACKGLLGF